MDNYLEILNRFDEGVENLFDPADLSIQDGLTEDIEKLQGTLKTSLGLECGISGRGGQYTTWYGSLTIVEDIYGNSCDDYDRRTNSGAALNIRFSNFGRLATVFGCNEKVASFYPVEAIAQHLREANFRYIPVEVLVTPYNGTRLEKSERFTWFFRYFFYPGNL